MMKKRLVVAMSGASGVIYGIRLLEVIKDMPYETHLIISQAAKLNIEIETSYKPNDVEAMADF
ncbi:MAG: flavoprotein, partial [Planctomycetota bacterium]